MTKDPENYMALSAISDTTAIERVLSGDVDAFEILMRRYQGHVMGVVRNHVPIDELEDVFQTVFIKAYQSITTYRKKGSFKNWLSGIAIRTCYDFWRHRYRQKEVPIGGLSASHQKWLDTVMAAQSADVYHAAEAQSEAREILSWALGQLSAEDRMVLELVYFQGMSGKEAATHLGWSVANVKIRSFRSRNRLKTILARFLGRAGEKRR